MFNVIVYDKAKYHYQGNFPKRLSIDQAFVHTGMFLGWIIDNNLFSKEFEEETTHEIRRFKQRELTGTQIYMKWDGVLASDMLNDEGNEFAKNYFDFETGLFPLDYEETFPKIPTIYHVKDTWENYFKIKKVIDKRYLEWVNQRPKLDSEKKNYIFEYEFYNETKKIKNPSLEMILENLKEINPSIKSFFILENESGDLIQCAGTKLRLTIEYKHSNIISKLGIEKDNKELISINYSAGPITVQRNEVLTVSDAIKTFESFYKTGKIPNGYILRQLLF